MKPLCDCDRDVQPAEEWLPRAVELAWVPGGSDTADLDMNNAQPRVVHKMSMLAPVMTPAFSLCGTPCPCINKN